MLQQREKIWIYFAIKQGAERGGTYRSAFRRYRQILCLRLYRRWNI